MVLWLIVSGIRSASNAISKALKGDDSQKVVFFQFYKAENV